MITKHRGTTVRMGDKDWIIPPLNLTAISQLSEKLDGFDHLSNFKQIEIVGELAHAALKRNYEELTHEQVADMLDLGNMQEVMGAIMAINGLNQGDAGEVPARKKK